VQARLRCKDGSSRLVRITASPRLDASGALAYSRCIVHDLSDAASAQELEHVAVERERLMGIIGHDMRNPLMAIHLAASALLRFELHENATRIARRILDSTDRMERMITQLVDFARIRAGAGLGIDPEEANLHKVTRRVLDELELAFPQAIIRLETQGELDGVWDPDRMAQVVSNLVANAIQHGAPGHPIKIGLVGSDAEVALVVTNDGEPIPPEVIPTLFSPFRRAKQANRPAYAAGTSLGLGLFIAQQIVEGHGGTIGVDCSGGTTTFTVTLPRIAPTLA
jgi:signal transduction histidine kinase